MKQIPISQIIIKENRQRQEFDPEALQELCNSISDRGLLHAPVLRQENGDWVLVAGERRMKAMEELHTLGVTFYYDNTLVEEGNIPYVSLGDLSVLEAEEAELDENLKRRDLTWQEHAAAVGRLHALRQGQKVEEYKDITSANLAAAATGEPIVPFPPAHTFADTAEELTGKREGSYQDAIRKEVLVSKHLDNPLVAKAKSAEEAFKILKREEERGKNQELARTVGLTFNVEKHRLIHGSCLEELAKPEFDSFFDVILTDPPYGMGADTFADGGGKHTNYTHAYDDSYESWKTLMSAWCPLSFKVAKPQAHAYVFCDIDRFHELKALMESAGWYVFRTPFIIHKLNSGRVPLPESGPRRQYELALYAIKGKKPVTHIYPDVISSSADEVSFHGAQKPVNVYENLLQRSVHAGDTILDCFAGSGPIFPAAHGFKCSAVGIEQSSEYYGLCIKRLEEIKKSESFNLFADLGITNEVLGS